MQMVSGSYRNLLFVNTVITRRQTVVHEPNVALLNGYGSWCKSKYQSVLVNLLSHEMIKYTQKHLKVKSMYPRLPIHDWLRLSNFRKLAAPIFSIFGHPCYIPCSHDSVAD